MNINTILLRYVVEVEKSKSISKAADNLYMAQPNLSKAIKELEETVGFPIFERGPKGTIPTDLGMEFIEQAHKVLAQIDAMGNLASGKKEGTIHFDVSIPRGSYISEGVLDFVRGLDFKVRTEVLFQETNALKAIHNVSEHRFNLGVIRYEKKNELYFKDYLYERNLKAETLWDFQEIVLMSKHHPLANKEKIELSDLEPYIEIVYEDEVLPYFHQLKKRREQPTSSKLSIFERSSQFQFLSTVSESYTFASPIPEYLLERYDVVQRKVYGIRDTYKDVIIYRKDYELSDLDKHFINKLDQARNNVAFLKLK